jgi:hypothetical protein
MHDAEKRRASQRRYGASPKGRKAVDDMMPLRKGRSAAAGLKSPRGGNANADITALRREGNATDDTGRLMFAKAGANHNTVVRLHHPADQAPVAQRQQPRGDWRSRAMASAIEVSPAVAVAKLDSRF